MKIVFQSTSSSLFSPELLCQAGTFLLSACLSSVPDKLLKSRLSDWPDHRRISHFFTLSWSHASKNRWTGHFFSLIFPKSLWRDKWLLPWECSWLDWLLKKCLCCDSFKVYAMILLEACVPPEPELMGETNMTTFHPQFLNHQMNETENIVDDWNHTAQRHICLFLFVIQSSSRTLFFPQAAL